MIDRYQTPEMRTLWSERRKFEIWRDIEVAACDALAQRGEIPAEAAAAVRQRAGFDQARIEQIEQTVQHDVIAFLTSMAEHIGEASRYVHLGMTSSDLLDTTLAVQCAEAGRLLVVECDRLDAAIVRRAQEHRGTVMMGRSHGMHAEPTTFGLKLLGWAAELRRGRARLQQATAGMAAGKLSGPVGTYAHIAPQVEADVCRRLGLAVDEVSTQIVARDRHAAFLAALALLAASLERFATELRHLQRNEVGEAEEPFGKGQKGSSAMPHKRNPVLCERICGMARVLRGHLVAGLENVALWHERDISHSSVERIILPDSTTLLHYMLRKMTGIIEGLRVFPERMRRNMERTHGLYHSGAVLLALARAGVSREDAYAAVQELAMRAHEQAQDFPALVRADARLRGWLPGDQLEACFDLTRHLRHVDLVFARVLGERA